MDDEGDVVAEDAEGDIAVEDAEGDVAVEDTAGDVAVEDAAGDVAVEDAEGDVAVAVADADDLTKIEGIGPETQDALNAAGVFTYAGLSQCDVSGLHDVYEGCRFACAGQNHCHLARTGKRCRGR